MAIIKQYHKDTDTTYVYESISYWDADKGQSRSKRRVIGKLDPVTGQVIPTGKRGRTKKEPAPASRETPASGSAAAGQEPDRKRSLELQLEINALRTRISELESQLYKYRCALEKLGVLAGKMDTICRDLPEA